MREGERDRKSICHSDTDLCSDQLFIIKKIPPFFSAQFTPAYDTHTHAHIHAHARTHTRPRTRTNTRTRTHARTHARTHTHAHINPFAQEINQSNKILGQLLSSLSPPDSPDMANSICFRQDLISALSLFGCGQASLQESVSVRRSVGPSVRRSAVPYFTKSLKYVV